MLVRRFAACALAMSMMVVGASVESAQSYPVKPIRVVTSEAGSANDIASRVLGQWISGAVGQQVITDNRGVRAMDIVCRAPADGYTVLVYGNTFWFMAFVQDGVSWNPVRDFSPITLVAVSPAVLVVHPALPAKSAEELIALAKARPGQLNYGSASLGSTLHLAAELFKSMAGVNIVRVPYKGAGQAINALMANEVQLAFVSTGVVMPQVKAGKLRGLAVTSLEPSRLAPGLPTLASSGVPGYESTTMVGVYAPARTPLVIINRLNHEIVLALKAPGVRERFLEFGMETLGSSSHDAAVKMKVETARMGKVIKDADVRLE